MGVLREPKRIPLPQMGHALIVEGGKLLVPEPLLGKVLNLLTGPLEVCNCDDQRKGVARHLIAEDNHSSTLLDCTWRNYYSQLLEDADWEIIYAWEYPECDEHEVSLGRLQAILEWKKARALAYRYLISTGKTHQPQYIEDGGAGNPNEWGFDALVLLAITKNFQRLLATLPQIFSLNVREASFSLTLDGQNPISVEHFPPPITQRPTIQPCAPNA